MPTLKELKDQHTALALKAHEVVTSGRPVAEIREELDKIEGNADNPETGTLKALQVDIADMEYVEEKRKSYGGNVGDAGSTEPVTEQPQTFKSLGDQWVESPEFVDVASRRKALGSSFQIATPAVALKATLTEGGLTSTDVVAQDRQPGVLPILFQRLTVADLMPSGTTNSSVVRYAKEGTATNAASTVAEGGAKPQITLNYTVVDEPVRKIADLIKVSDEMLEDLPFIASEVNGRLVLFVRIREEQQLLTGNGVAPDLTGLLNRSGLTAAQAVGSETYGKVAIAVHKEITKIRVASFLDPDGLVFHPNDWEGARFEADANGQFFGGGPFTGAYGVNGIPGDTYWGLRVVSTTAMTENTILIGAFQTGAKVFRRTGINVDMTNSNDDDFTKNLISIRAEERLALAVYRPAAFGTVTGA